MPEKIFSVYGIGNPLMDLITQKEYSFLTELGVQPGTMNLLSLAEMQQLLLDAGPCEQVPGGSCANTLRGLAWLGKYKTIKLPVYSGAVGQDNRGRDYISLMEKNFGIKTLVSRKRLETGFSIIIVTPDFERTMFTYLGACREFEQADLDFSILAGAEILHMNGYMWDTDSQKQAVREAIAFAGKNDIRVSFDLADPFVVKRNREEFLNWIGNSVDILFGNMEEFSILTGAGKEPDRIVEAATGTAGLAIVKAGADGCYVNDHGRITRIGGKKVQAVDTVGAGDSFASGFLFGMLNGTELAGCGELANSVAAGIVAVEGCNFDKLDYRDVFA